MTTASDESLIRLARTGWPLYGMLALLFGLYLGVNQIIGLGSKGSIAPWKPLVWELSSTIVIFAVVPLIVRFERHFRLDSRPRWRIVLAHAGAAFLFSAWHVSSIVVLRKLAYSAVGQNYTFGNVPIQFYYELQIDLIVYAVILVVIFPLCEFQITRSSD